MIETVVFSEYGYENASEMEDVYTDLRYPKSSRRSLLHGVEWLAAFWAALHALLSDRSRSHKLVVVRHHAFDVMRYSEHSRAEEAYAVLIASQFEEFVMMHKRVNFVLDFDVRRYGRVLATRIVPMERVRVVDPPTLPSHVTPIDTSAHDMSSAFAASLSATNPQSNSPPSAPYVSSKSASTYGVTSDQIPASNSVETA